MRQREIEKDRQIDRLQMVGAAGRDAIDLVRLTWIWDAENVSKLTRWSWSNVYECVVWKFPCKKKVRQR